MRQMLCAMAAPDGPLIDDKRFRVLMETWRDWCRRDRWVEGYADHSPTFRESRSGMDWTDLEESVDGWTAEIIDAEVRSLPLAERTAMHHVWLLAVWRLREPMDAVYARAKDRLILRLHERGLV